MHSTTLDIAQRWVDDGYSVIPITYRSKRPAFDALRATGSIIDGDISWSMYKERQATADELKIWFSGPKRNLGIVTGYNRLVVLDFDTIELYTAWAAWAESVSDIAAVFQASTYRVYSARGVHVYITCDEPVEPYRVAEVDIKARWGYVLAPPSVHPSGCEYRGEGDTILHCEHLSDVFPLVKPEPENLSLTPDGISDPWDVATRAVECGGMGSIEYIKSHVRVEDILHITEKGKNPKILCPFHSDKNPSLSVDIAKQTVFCFGCGFHGDVLDVYAALNKITIRETISLLSAR